MTIGDVLFVLGNVRKCVHRESLPFGRSLFQYRILYLYVACILTRQIFT
jgi:hypothetical protein